MGIIRMILVELHSSVSVEDVAICVFSIYLFFLFFLSFFTFFLWERELQEKAEHIEV